MGTSHQGTDEYGDRRPVTAQDQGGAQGATTPERIEWPTCRECGRRLCWKNCVGIYGVASSCADHKGHEGRCRSSLDRHPRPAPLTEPDAASPADEGQATCPDCYTPYPAELAHNCPIGELKRRVQLLESVVLEHVDHHPQAGTTTRGD